MGLLERGAAALGRGLWRVAIALLAVGIVIGTFTYLGNNQAQLNSVVQSGGDFASTAAITTFDWATEKMGGSASSAQAATVGPETIWVESKAPARWQVGRAMRLWNQGLTGAQLKAGKCRSGSPCIKVSQAYIDTPDGQSLVLGKTTRLFGTRVKFNSAAVGHVPAASYYAFASCHELGHALGLEHRSATSCMHASAKGAATRPDKVDFAAVNAEYGH